MEEFYQRVLDLDKIDSKEAAYIAGYQTKVWWKGTYQYQKNIDLLNQNLIMVECPYRKHYYQEWHDLICDNFIVIKDEYHVSQKQFDKWISKGISKEIILNSEGYKKASVDYRLYLKINENSKSHIGNKLPICKHEFKPYEYLGFYHKCGYINNDNGICFINSKAAVKTFKKQLLQWYGFETDDFSDTIKQVNDTPFYVLTICPKAKNKFFDILPDDYKEKFKLQTVYPVFQ